MSLIAQKKSDSLRPVRRCVRPQAILADGTQVFVTKSFSNEQDKWHPSIDFATGAVFCDCHDFTYRCAKLAPSVESAPVCLCKHLVFPILNAIRSGKLVASPARMAELEAAKDRKKGFSREAKAQEQAQTQLETHGDLAPVVVPCCNCHERATKYSTCDESGRLISRAGLCEECMPAQTPDEDEILRAEVAAYKAQACAGCDFDSFVAVHEAADSYRQSINDLWHNEELMLIELNETRNRYKELCEVEMTVYDPDLENELYDLEKRIEEIHNYSFTFDFADVNNAVPYPEF